MTEHPEDANAPSLDRESSREESSRSNGALEPAEPAAGHPPLGLPRGSVRALLTLLIVAVVIVEVLRGEAIDLLWTETLIIVLAYYFTSRRFVDLPHDVLRRLEEEGHVPREPRPLYLPSFVIPGLILLAFAGLAVYLQRAGRLFETQAVGVLILVLSYAGGVFWRIGEAWWTARWPGNTTSRWDDTLAGVVLSLMAGIAVFYLLGLSWMLPSLIPRTTLILVLFYFGSR